MLASYAAPFCLTGGVFLLAASWANRSARNRSVFSPIAPNPAVPGAANDRF
jgi:hypothetical protein